MTSKSSGLFHLSVILFEPLDIKQWNTDKAIDFLTDPMDYDSVDYFQVNKRLKNPVSAYTKEKIDDIIIVYFYHSKL